MWLIRDDVAQAIAQAKRSKLTFTAEQCAELFGRGARSRSQGSGTENPAMTIAGDLAEIRVIGTLTPQPDIFAWLFGGGNTTYQDLIEAFSVASASADIKRVHLLVDSPGGTVAGLFETLAAIEGTEKPISVIASQACSAAYAIAAVASKRGQLIATNAAAQFGSIGVATRLFVDEEIIDIASTDAPKKRPDPTTDEGKAVIREYLDAIHELFADAIAHGRGVDRKEVNAEFGRGAILLAGEAKKRGLIDKIQTPALRPVGGGRRKAAAAAEGDSEDSMDLNTLKTKHPELYNAVVLEGRGMGPATAPTTTTTTSAPDSGAGAKPMDLKQLKAQHPEAYDAAVAEGVKQERDRVNAHLTAGEMSGDTKTAYAAIRDGQIMTMTLQTQYMMAAANRSDRRTRQTETDEAAAAADGARQTPKADLGDQVADLVEEQLGKKKAS